VTASKSPFTLREAHMQAIRQVGQAHFSKTVMAHLRENNTEAVAALEDPELERRVHIALARARSHGIENQRGLVLFVAFMFEIAPNFDTHPPIRAMLQDTSIPPDARIQRVADEVSPDQWVEASEAADPTIWQSPTTSDQ
jgi:hypothetical protein